MKLLKKFRFLLLFVCAFLFFAGCPDHGGSYGISSYFLVNGTNELIRYESHRKNATFNIVLHPYDTIFLYSKEQAEPDDYFVDSVFYLSNDSIIIKDNNGIVLFFKGYRTAKKTSCGAENFVGKSLDSDRYYWTIDSDYIADKSCSALTDDDDFEEE